MSHRQLDCKDCVTKNCSILKHCPSKWLTLISDSKISMFVKKGQRVIYEGTPAMGIYFLHSGKVKVHKSGMHDKQLILKLAKEGDILGHRGFGKKLFYPATVSTIEDSFFCFLDNEVLHRVLKNVPDLTYELMMFYAEELRLFETRIVNLLQMNVREKIADTLILLNDTFGIDLKTKALNASLSRQELADIAGTTKEQVSKTLSEFAHDKIIEVKTKEIKINNFEKLLSIAGYTHYQQPN